MADDRAEAQYYRELALKLADLYGDAQDIRRVAEQAGLSVEHIPVAAKPVTHWHGVIQEARKAEWGMESLLLIVKSEYSDNLELMGLIAMQPTGDKVSHEIGRMAGLLGNQLAGIRDDMASLERRINERIDGLSNDLNAFKATAMIYNDKRRMTWLGGFVILLFTLLITIPGIYEAVGFNTQAVITIAVLGWVMGGGLVMYGLGFLRGL